MADYRDRIAARIKREMALQGENEVDLAQAIGATPRTVERWTAGETVPQRRYRKPVADHLKVPMEELYPDLEEQERAVLDQLDRIEEKIDKVLTQLGIRADAEKAGKAATRAAEESKRKHAGSQHKRRANPKKRKAG